jgi:hypothetical protein
MDRHDHSRLTGARRPGRWLTLSILALAIALAGCGGGTDTVVVTGSPSVDVPVAPATSGPGASGSGASGSGAAGGARASGGGADATAPPNPTAPPASADDAPVDIVLGGPTLGIPNNPPVTPLHSFGEVAVDAESARRFRLRSSSGGAVEVLALTVAGDDGFLLTDDACTGATLPPGGSGGCAFAVVFRPGQVGAATGELLVRLARPCTAADPPCGAGTGAVLATGRVAAAQGQAVAVARLEGHGTTAPAR